MAIQEADVPGTLDVTVFTCFIKFNTFLSSILFAVTASPCDMHSHQENNSLLNFTEFVLFYINNWYQLKTTVHSVIVST